MHHSFRSDCITGVRVGVAKHLLPRCFPFVPGTDIAAEVVTLGPGVTGFKPGDKVITYVRVLVRCSRTRFSITHIAMRV